MEDVIFEFSGFWIWFLPVVLPFNFNLLFRLAFFCIWISWNIKKRCINGVCCIFDFSVCFIVSRNVTMTRYPNENNNYFRFICNIVTILNYLKVTHSRWTWNRLLSPWLNVMFQTRRTHLSSCWIDVFLERLLFLKIFDGLTLSSPTVRRVGASIMRKCNWKIFQYKFRNCVSNYNKQRGVLLHPWYVYPLMSRRSLW